jgi:hypothetical protein
MTKEEIEQLKRELAEEVMMIKAELKEHKEAIDFCINFMHAATTSHAKQLSESLLTKEQLDKLIAT